MKNFRFYFLCPVDRENIDNIRQEIKGKKAVKMELSEGQREVWREICNTKKWAYEDMEES